MALTKHGLPALSLALTVAGCAHARPLVVTQAPAPIPTSAAAAAPPEVVPQGAPAGATASPAGKPADSLPAAPRMDSIGVTADEIARRAVDLFGDSATAATGAADDSAAGPSWDIDVHSYESRSRVAHYVQVFSTSARETIESQLERGTRYEPMIRARMRAGGLPEDMYYLALIESGFDPNAYSHAAAVGMWQFMSSTARDMGLRVDWWIDERRDPVRSTGAAVRLLKGMQEQFGSLYLAAAAYDGGPGRIARGLTKYADDLDGTTGDDLFFALAEKNYLRPETREYVPQLIAAALIGKEPERYGLKVDPQPPFTYDSVRVGPGTPLAAIARAADTTVAALHELDPQILRGVTPPRDSVLVRIPAGRADSFAVNLAALPASEREGLHRVESRKGESVATIARRAGITARQLDMYNPKLRRLKSGNLVPGQILLVPTREVVAAAVAVPDPAIERYSSAKSTHVVRSGETLSGIAKKYHTTVSSLMRLNGLKRALIFPGQTLVVSGSAARRPVKSTKKAHTVSRPRHNSTSKSGKSAKSSKSGKSRKSTTSGKKKTSAVKHGAR
ncbi:MAG TPA: transglycosylase SLT domain-containing protein [Gemmatimonadaceae bacterium]|nr:transglycosylase SLT domain-containing protein [Gemmatimonadaceae bacterium]